MSKYLTVVPAYGRDYTSAKAVRAAWAEGRDFYICDAHHPDDGRAVNNHDIGSGVTVNVRYKDKREVCVIAPAKGKAVPQDKPGWEVTMVRKGSNRVRKPQRDY